MNQSLENNEALSGYEFLISAYKFNILNQLPKEVGRFEILLGFTTLLLCLYYYFTYNFDFWKKRNVPGPRPIPIFGNVIDSFFGKVHGTILTMRFYNQFKKEPLVGIFRGREPVLIVKDLDLIKDVLIKDFNVFCDRGFHVSTDPTQQNLLNLEFKRWKPLRATISPMFTTNKIKNMTSLVEECGKNFEKYVERTCERSEVIECAELAAKYTTETIVVCAFGLNSKSITDEDSQFRISGRHLVAPTFKNVIRYFVRSYLPTIYNKFGTLLFHESRNFFLDSMRKTVSYRKQNNIKRNDFLASLLTVQEKSDKIPGIEFTEDFLVGQTVLFFTAGFETSSSVISNSLYELAFNHDVQDKLREEIKREIEASNGELTYETLEKMTYLHKVVKETLRKHPPLGTTPRKSSAPYTFAGTNVSIPANFTVHVPVMAIHYDPDIYPSPDRFDPERFNEENVKMRHPMTYLPFGQGPHICIGAKFAYVQSKIGIISILKNYKVDICDKTRKDFHIAPQGFFTSMPSHGLYLRFTRS